MGDSESAADSLLIVVSTETEQGHLVSALAKLGMTAEPSKHAPELSKTIVPKRDTPSDDLETRDGKLHAH